MTDHTYLTACHHFAKAELSPRVDALDRAGVFPAELHALAEAAGLRHAGIPVALGGGGVSHRGLVAGGVLLAQVCAPASFSLSFNHGTLRPLLQDGRQEWVARLVREGTRER